MKGKPNPRREELRELSAQIRPLVKAGVFQSVNAGLLHLYSEQTGCSEWRTFKGWIDAGRPVRKGERGFPIWAQPRQLSKPDDNKQPGEVSSAELNAPEWFPVCYLFHAGQVEQPEKVAA